MKDFNTLYEMARTEAPIRIAAAGPAKHEILQTLRKLQVEGLASLAFIGDTAWIFQSASREEIDLTKVEIIHEPDLALPAAKLTVKQAKEGKAQILLNGYVSPQDMLEAAFDPRVGIKKDKVMSRLSALELPHSSKLLFIADTGITDRPGAKEKREILENALEYFKRLGVNGVRVAVLKTPSMVGLKESMEYYERVMKEEMAILKRCEEEFPGLILQGPMNLEEAMQGEVPDLLLVSNAEVGQMLTQALCTFAGGKVGHVILGGQVPLVLVTNHMTEEQMWNSILLALAGLQDFVPQVE